MNIEFVEPRLPSRRAWLLVLALAALASVLFAAARVMEARTRALDDDWRARELASRRAAPVAAPRVSPPYEAEATRALDRAALPEASALGELEAVAVAGIALQSIDVDMAQRRVVVELRSASEAALEDYVDQLNAGLPVSAWRVERLAAAERGPAASAAEQAVSLARRF